MMQKKNKDFERKADILKKREVEVKVAMSSRQVYYD